MKPAPDDDQERLRDGTGDPTGALDRLAQEFVDRARRGEGPSIEAYASAHPDLAADIRELFPVLAVVEGLKETPGDVAPREDATRQEDPARTLAGGSSPSRRVPTRIGPYRIVREIGRGGMGTVYEGLCDGAAGEAERVAVKIIHPHLLDELEYVARFLREADAGRRVDHPNVVRTLSTGMLDLDGEEVPYLVLEYVDGQNLRALLREVEVVPERLCRHIGARIADALAATHAVGLVHRDVKPENVVITVDETVKLADLGVAVLQDRTARLSGTGDFVGSLLYAAPEQLLGEPPDPRWDLHSLGVVLYELATGSHPGRAQTVGWQRRDAPLRRPASARQVDPRISPFFDAVITALLAVDPERRFASAEELLEALNAGEDGSWWRAARARAPRAASRLGTIHRPTRFHGRQSECAVLNRTWAATVAGAGRSVLIVGEAGIGKSRLVQEWLAARQDADDARVLLLRHGPGGSDSHGSELLAAVRELAGCELEPERLRELLGTLAPLAEMLTRHLGGEAVPPASLLSLEAATTRLLASLASEFPLVVILEDLHFAGQEGQQRFLRLARALESCAVLLLGTTRPVPPPTWAAELEASPSFTRLGLEGLDTRACRDLIVEASSNAALVDESIARLTRRADRNPFFLLELVREAKERRRTAPGSRGSDTQVPRTVQSVIASRLAALDPTDRELLEVASCCGDEFDPVIAAEAAGVPRIDALKRFGRLERAQQLLRPVQRSYQFQHHLVQETLYAGVHPALKEAYHAALGRALEARSAEPEVGARAVALCRHFLEGGEPLKARPHIRSALEHMAWEVYGLESSADFVRRALEIPDLLAGADRAFALMARGTDLVSEARYDEAHTLLTEALHIVPDGDRSGIEEDALRALARLQGGQALLDEMDATYERAAACARAHGNLDREAMAMSGLAQSLIRRGRLDDAERAIRRGFDALRSHPDTYQEGRLNAYRAQIEVVRGRYDAAQPLLERAQLLCHSVGDLSTEMLALNSLAGMAADRGSLKESLRLLQRQLEVERQMGHPHLLVYTMGNVAHCLRELGRIGEACECASQAYEIAIHRDDAQQQASAGLRLGTLLLDQGRLVEAERKLLAGWERGFTHESPQFIAAGALGLTWLYGLEGREREAFDVLARVRGEGVPRWPQRFELRLLLNEGALHERMGRWEQALEIYEGVHARAPESSVGRRIAELSLSRAAIRCGPAEEAQGTLRELLAWGREVGMVHVVVLAEVLLAGLPEGDLLAARVTLERNETSLSVSDRIAAYYELWRVGGEVEHLQVAGRHLDAFAAGAPAEHRETVVTRVEAHRQIREALGAPPSS